MLENVENETLNNSDDILAKLKGIMNESKKEKGQSHTIYLSSDVTKMLYKLIKRSGKSKSVIIDEILREVLAKI